MVNHSLTLDRTFGALADPVRRAMLAQLARGDASVTELGASHSLTLPGVLKHVRYLESAGLLSARKEGRTRMCRLAPKPLLDASQWLDHYRLFWETQLDALEHFINSQRKSGDDSCPPPRKTSRSKPNASSAPRRTKSSPPGPKRKR